MTDGQVAWYRLPCPTQKNFYPSRAAAIQDRNFMHKGFRLSRHAAPGGGERLKMTPYRCRLCGGWHLTSQPKRHR